MLSMHTKQFYRAWFANVSQYLKMSYFLKNCNISASAFSKFMKGYQFDFMLSEYKCHKLYSFIQEVLSKNVV